MRLVWPGTAPLGITVLAPGFASGALAGKDTLATVGSDPQSVAMAATCGGTYFKSFGLDARGAIKYSSAFAELAVPELKNQYDKGK